MLRHSQSKLSPSHFLNTTTRAQREVQRALDHAHRLQTDPDREQRLARSLCPACFYRGPRIAGQAFTVCACMVCGVDQTYSSTHTDELCLPCAQQHGLCKHCGGDVALNTERTDWPSAAPSTAPMGPSPQIVASTPGSLSGSARDESTADARPSESHPD